MIERVKEMKQHNSQRLALILLLLAIAVPAWAGKKITVGQLEELLRTMQQDKKADADVATELKQIELSEELTRTAMNSLMLLVPGPRTTEQIYVLEARSADLIPPSSDLPSTPAPDDAAQHAILAKASTYVNDTFNKLPGMTATRATLRFQDNVEAVAASSGISGSATDVTTNSGFSNPASFVHYINSTEAVVELDRGVAQTPPGTNKIAWGANKMIALLEPDPSLGVVFKEAEASGSIKWLRWELINGKQVAVFSFAVTKDKSRLALNVCCFPSIKQAGVATFYTATTAISLGGGGNGSGGGGVTGNFQTNTDWHNYKTTAPYHGKFFIEPTTGLVARMITEAELKPSDVVHQVDTRIDYAPAKIGTKILVVPIRSITSTEVVPNGDSGAGGYTVRHTFFTSAYKDHQLGAVK